MSTLKLSAEQIEALKEMSYFSDIEELLATLLGKDTIESMDIEPYLEALAEKRTFLGHTLDNLDYSEIVDLLNYRYGNLCYLAYYEADKVAEDCAFYEEKWGRLLELCQASNTDEDDLYLWTSLGASIQMKFTPFKDKNKTKTFADQAYAKALEVASYTGAIVSLAGGHFMQEYYTNEELLAAAAAKAFELANNFYDYQSICFDSNDNCLFEDTPYYKMAAEKAVGLRDTAEYAWKNLEERLVEQGEDIAALKAAALANFDTTKTYTFRKEEMVTDIRYYEVTISGEMAKLYQEDEDAFWEKFEEDDLEGEWDFVNDRVGDPDTKYRLKL